MKRDYLVFCSSNHGIVTPELYGDERKFDVCIHDYGHWTDHDMGVVRRSEYYFPYPNREKLETAAEIIPALPSYKYYAFLDDDLTVTTDELNRLFQVGDGLRLDLYQPALTRNSHSSWGHLLTQNLGHGLWNFNPVRSVEVVEIMCPFFSAKGLEACLPTFDINLSGWGLDCYMWPKRVARHVIDTIPIGHYREPGRRQRKLRNGLTPYQELWIMKKIHNPDDCSPPPV